MTHARALLFLLPCALLTIGIAQAKRCAPANDAAVVEVMSQLFQAATRDDEHLFQEILAPDFYAYDNGHRYEGMQLPELIKGAHAGGKKYVWGVTDPGVVIECDAVWFT